MRLSQGQLAKGADFGNPGVGPFEGQLVELP